MERFGFDLERVWVEVRIDGTDYVFDPAFKVHTVRTGIDLGAAMGYDRQSLLGSALAGATVTSNSVQSLNDANLRLALDGFAANLADVIRNDHSGATIDEILDLARRTLLAAHPALGDPDAPYWAADRDALCRAARVLIARSATLHRAIRSYETAATELLAQSEDGSDLPF